MSQMSVQKGAHSDAARAEAQACAIMHARWRACAIANSLLHS